METIQTNSNLLEALPSLELAIGKLSPDNKLVLAEVFEQKQISTASILKLMPRKSKIKTTFPNAVSDLTKIFDQYGVVVKYLSIQKDSYTQSNGLILTPNFRTVILKEDLPRSLISYSSNRIYITTFKEKESASFNLKEMEELAKDYLEDGDMDTSLSPFISEADWYLNKITKHKVLDKKLVYKLIKDAQGGNIDARNILILHNQKLVVHVANKVCRGTFGEDGGLELYDIVQEANVGLCKAIDKFDLSLGYAFSTYAYWWIFQSIKRNIHDHKLTIRIPVHMQEKLSKFRKIYYLIENETGESPNMRDVASELKITVKEALALENANRRKDTVTFDNPVNSSDEDGDSRNLYETIGDKSAVTLELLIDREILKERVKKVLKANLTAKEYEIVDSRFGLTDNKPLVLEKIGHKFDVTKERIRQIVETAIEKIRHDESFREFAREYLEKNI